MTIHPKDQAPDALRTHFEALASDPSFKLSRSRRGIYVNPAVARDWKWFQLGASRAQQPAPASSDWDVRGHLAASLTCWHRLTGQEADELVAMFKGRTAPLDNPPMPEHWGVVVSVNGDNILCIGESYLHGKRELNEAEENAVIGVAQHLLAFVGYGLPPSSFDPDADEASPQSCATPDGEPSNVELRGMWYGAGGMFHGPNVETGTMPEHKLLPFLRSLASGGQAPAGATFQQRVQPWLLQCFGAEIAADRVERNHRFLEESIELVQALGCTASEAHQLVDYVFGRPVGDPPQEVGGVMVTLAALCLASGLDMHDAGEVELRRISAPELVAKIRAKQAAKPKHSPLPQSVAHQPGSALEDAALLDWQASARVEVSPEYEGPWHAAVFGEDEKPVFLASGNTPREALIAARKQGGV